MNNETKKTFYARCGEIIGVEHDWNEPVKRRTRWNNRFLGNGRYPGFGTIRFFNPNFIHVMSRHHGAKTFKGEEEVYDFLKKVTGCC